MTYPSSVYHKDYDPKKGDVHPADQSRGKSGHEVYLEKYHRLVKSREEHEALGPDWGYPSEEAEVEEEVDDLPVVAEVPKGKWSRK